MLGKLSYLKLIMIFHQKLYDPKTHMMILPYFATNDTGMKDYWTINPRKMVIWDNGTSNSIYTHNVHDIAMMLKDEKLYERMVDSNEIQKRESEHEKVDIIEIKEEMLIQLDRVTI